MSVFQSVCEALVSVGTVCVFVSLCVHLCVSLDTCIMTDLHLSKFNERKYCLYCLSVFVDVLRKASACEEQTYVAVNTDYRRTSLHVRGCEVYIYTYLHARVT